MLQQFHSLFSSFESTQVHLVLCIIFLYFTSDINIGRFADEAKLTSVFKIPEVKNPTQRDLDKLEKWVCLNLRKINKAKQLGWGNPKQQYKLSDECT